MKYTYDCEFHEDGVTIDFISIGMVNMDTGAEFYMISNECDTRRIARNDWLMKNVMSSIHHQQFVVADFAGAPYVRDIFIDDCRSNTKAEIALQLEEFIGDDPEPEFWAWYSAYDHVCLAQLWGKMIDLPDNVPMWTNDIKTLHKQAGYPEMPKQYQGNHNALDDAKFNVLRYDYLMGVLTERRRGGML